MDLEKLKAAVSAPILHAGEWVTQDWAEKHFGSECEAQFVSTFSPNTVRELIAEIERLRATATSGTTPLVATEAIQNAFDDEHHRACSRDEFYAAMLTA